MIESIHGHEVMRMMLDAGRPFTHEELETAIHTRFGSGARFHTCSAENMSARELIAFLDARGKFSNVGGGLQTGADRICHHENTPGE